MRQARSLPGGTKAAINKNEDEAFCCLAKQSRGSWQMYVFTTQ